MEVGGCDLIQLAREHGTPLYVYDEATVRQRASEYVAAMGSAGQVLYSAKAFASPRFLRVRTDDLVCCSRSRTGSTPPATWRWADATW